MTNEQQLIYLAGIVDGEGCLTSSRQKNRRHKPALRIAGTYKPLMQWLKMLFGGNYYVIKPRKGQSKTSYDWVLNTNQAIDLVKSLLPYLKIKKREAEVFVLFYKQNILATIKLAKKLTALKHI